MWGEMTPIGAISDVKELGAPSSATTATLGHMPNGRFDAVDFNPSYRGSVRPKKGGVFGLETAVEQARDRQGHFVGK